MTDKKTTDVKKVKKIKRIAKLEKTAGVDLSYIIKRPRVTEKAGLLAENKQVYTFEVHKDATKKDVKKAVKALYKVDAIKVNMINLPMKKVMKGGKVGHESAIRKAIVSLRKGEKIEFI